MSSSKHTPGPWEVLNGTSIMASPNKHIPDTMLGIANVMEFEGERPAAVTEANARLIAAAPHLLAALKAFAEHFGPLEDNEMLHEDARRCFAIARAALSMVEGRS